MVFDTVSFTLGAAHNGQEREGPSPTSAAQAVWRCGRRGMSCGHQGRAWRLAGCGGAHCHFHPDHRNAGSVSKGGRLLRPPSKNSSFSQPALRTLTHGGVGWAVQTTEGARLCLSWLPCI